jgi:glycosyltransferase involved in cell wall biosynthesis
MLISKAVNHRKRVVILTGNHICHNPRAFKEAETLAERGCDITWLGGWFDTNKAERDREILKTVKWTFHPVTDWTSDAGRIGLRHWQRFRHRIAIEAYEHFNFESPLQLGYCAPELLRFALLYPAELYIAHSESAMWVAKQLLDRGRCVGIDMEDWFSEQDLLLELRRGRRPLLLLKNLEKALLQKSAYKVCPSRVMSEALAKVYQCDPPSVIYSAYPWLERERLDGQVKDRRDCSIPSIHWFSQTVGPGRGLEDLFAALSLVSLDCEIHLRGGLNEGGRRWLNQITPAAWSKRVFVHALVHNEELLSRIVEHDVGFAGEPNSPRNRDMAVTNKIMYYLLGGLAVVASETTGQREVADLAPGAVILYPSGDSAALATSLTALLGNSEQLLAAKSAALRAAKETFCWERVCDQLIESIDRALGSVAK